MQDRAGRDTGQVVVVSGSAGSGKTTLAIALARRAALALFDLDLATGALTSAALALLGCEEHALDEAGPGAALRAARYASLLECAGANVALGRDVVVAAPFSREIADPAAWAQAVATLTEGRVDALGDGPSSSPKVLLVYLDCPPELCRARLAARGAARDELKLAGGVVRIAGRRPNVPHLVVDASTDVTSQVEQVLACCGPRYSRHLGVAARGEVGLC